MRRSRPEAGDTTHAYRAMWERCYVTDHVLPDPATSSPVVVNAGRRPAVRFERRSEHPDHELDDSVTYLVWDVLAGVGLVAASGYTGPGGPTWARFLVDMEAMVVTLELSGGGVAPPPP